MIILRDGRDLFEQVVDEPVFLGRDRAVHDREGFANFLSQKLVERNHERRQFELVDDAGDLGEGAIQAFADVGCHGFVEFLDLVLRVVEVVRDRVVQADAAFFFIAAIQRLQPIAVLKKIDSVKASHHFLGLAVVKNANPKLRGGVRHQRKFITRKKDRPRAADDFAKRIEQRLQQIDGAELGPLVGKVRRDHDLQNFRQQSRTEQRAGQPRDGLAVARSDFGDVADAPAHLLKGRSELRVRPAQPLALRTVQRAEVLKMRHDVRRRHFIERRQAGLIERLKLARMRADDDARQQAAGH